MKFDLIRPCDNCPFRSDKPFPLAPGRVREILGGGKGRKWWPATSFPCHKTVDYGRSDAGRVGPNAQQCAGVMIILLQHFHVGAQIGAPSLGLELIAARTEPTSRRERRPCRTRSMTRVRAT